MDNRVYYNFGGGDEQYTPESGVELLLPHIQHWKNKIIWCPFDTEESNFVRVLDREGFAVRFSHKDLEQDFFEYEPVFWDIIISNPPYKNKRIFMERAMSFGKPFILLLPINILSDTVCNILFDSEDLQLFIPKKRMRFYNNITGEVGKQPTFKAAYFGYKAFKENLILEK